MRNEVRCLGVLGGMQGARCANVCKAHPSRDNGVLERLDVARRTGGHVGPFFGGLTCGKKIQIPAGRSFFSEKEG